MTAPFSIPNARIEGILGAVARDEAVDEVLPDDGRIHVDRRRPFLCVYRRPHDRSDNGTDSLLTSQAAFLLSAGRTSRQEPLTKLRSGLIGLGIDAFGGFLVIEVWTRKETGQDTRPEHSALQTPPSIRIFAPQKNVPEKTLKAFERAIIETDWPIEKPVVTINYCKCQHPEKLPPLLPARESKELNVVFLGLEVSPFFRNPLTGDIYPQVLNEFRHALGIALKQAFFTFSHTRATYRPTHYHELGSMVVPDKVWEVDRQLAVVGDTFDLLFHVTPVNASAAWQVFKSSQFESPPEFAYRPLQIDTAALKAQLFGIPVREIEDPALYHLMADKQDELDRQITLLADRGTPRLLYGSLLLFGAPDAGLASLANSILSQLPPHSGDDRVSDFVDAETFAGIAREEIEHYRNRDASFIASVELRDDVPGLLVSKTRLIVGTRVKIAKSRVEATLHHEIGTHILTYHNGLAQPFRLLHTGLAGYEELQEGLAVFSEYLVGGLTRPRMRTLAGRVLAVASLADGADFIETFRLLHEDFGFSQKSAYTIAMRVYRGGGYAKDVIYLRGLVGLLHHLAHGAALEDLLLGKYSLNHAALVEELKWRSILRPGVHQPRYLENPDALVHLKRAGEGLSVAEIIREGGI